MVTKEAEPVRQVTLDLPEWLWKTVKATAALRGQPLKDLVAETLISALKLEPASDARELLAKEQSI